MTLKLQIRWKKKWAFVFLFGLLLSFGLGYASKDILRNWDVVMTTAPASVEEIAVVHRVIDGDTVELADGRRVRYVGIDAPEISRDGRNGECFGEEAKEKNKDLVEGKEVRLVRDISEKDKYGRWLYLVFSGDILVEESLMRGGYAKEMTIKPDVRYAVDIKRWEHEAREKNLGVWGCKR